MWSGLVRKVHQRRVLGEHTVDEVQITGDATTIVETTAGDEHHRDTDSPRIRDGVANEGIQPIISGDRAVVVERENRELRGVTDLPNLSSHTHPPQSRPGTAPVLRSARGPSAHRRTGSRRDDPGRRRQMGVQLVVFSLQCCRNSIHGKPLCIVSGSRD